MKIFVILIYLLICYILNIKSIVFTPSIQDSMNLMFLNISSFSKYQLEEWNIPYFINYVFFIYLLLYINLTQRNEQSSFMGLVLYRSSKKNIFYTFLVKNIIGNVVLCTVLIFCLLCMGNFSYITYDWNQYILCIIFICRFILVFIIGMFIYDLGILFGKETLVNYFVIASILFLLIMDLIIHTHFITYSDNLKSEYVYLFFFICLFLVAYLIGRYEFIKRKGDIL